MHSILKSWNEKNLRTLRDIAEGDGAPKRKSSNRNDQYQRHGETTVTELEREAIRRALEEG
jgi:DNA replication protein DnaD